MHAITRIPKEDFRNHPLTERLLMLHDVPEELFIQGTLPQIEIDKDGRATPRILTIVGSRKCTPYGKHALEYLIKGLKGTPVIILSGLALGIDGIAHNEALKHSLITCAVPGSGLGASVLYPRAHVSLSKEILAQGGLLMSELEENTRPAQWTFPARNRIMAALCDALLVVEAGEKSGTLITARQALELGKEIGAVPGEILSETSSGTNALIRDGATPILSSEDICEMLRIPHTPSQTPTNHTFSKEETLLLSLLGSPLSKDTLLLTSKLPLQTFLITMSSLEMKGVVEETFGEVRRIV